MAPVRNLTILQNNINSIRPVANRSLLTKLLNHHNIDIAILSEIWSTPQEDVKFSGYKFLKKNKRQRLRRRSFPCQKRNSIPRNRYTRYKAY